MAGEDYEVVSMNLTFSCGSMDNATQCLYVMITNDTLVEGDETFAVALTLTTTELGVTTGNDMTAVIIMDNEGQLLNLIPALHVMCCTFLQMHWCPCPLH